ncbi:MAG: ATP-dependent DNA helicase RecG [Candidatus Omnitrophica bacterium]|nr:ATP-dependent DNA helicase RecG [Candidatus Omnitrophota bacterium]
MTTTQEDIRSKAIRFVKGVGPQRMEQLARLGIETLEDACYYAPRRYEDRSCFAPIRNLVPGKTATIHGTVLSCTLTRIRAGRSLVKAELGDETGVLQVTWFNQPYLARQLKVGERLILYGKVESSRRVQMIHPEMERMDSQEEDAALHMGRIVPIYPLVSGISQRWLRQILHTVLQEAAKSLHEVLPDGILRQENWPDISSAIHQLHFPDSWEELKKARERLAFEELWLFQLAICQRRARIQAIQKPQRYQFEGPVVEQLYRRIPFALTEDQKAVLQELKEGLAQPHPMHRLLQGEVGCGKTIVLVFLLAIAVQSGYQAAVMAPTELLAQQHQARIQQLLEPLGIRVALLAQSVPPMDRDKLLGAIAGGQIPLVIGTHALLQQDVVFQRLALVVIDEQHKFSVAQRASLANKAKAPDVVVVTATPIPRTAAMTIYGDLDISTIRHLPSGRQPVATRWLQEEERPRLYSEIREQLVRRRQAYVVYPLVVESEQQAADVMISAAEQKAATRMARHLQEKIFPEFRVGLLHGQMSSPLKTKAMQDFAEGKTQLLVSTVIIEVGLDVANATVMVIEHPERFGLAQLHQLRGRIGRGSFSSTCYLVSDEEDEAVRERLKAFVAVTDGFQLAEQDLLLRGPGELLGQRQHGQVRLRIADLSRDQALLFKAKDQALDFFARNRKFSPSLLAALRKRMTAFRGQREGAS